MLPHPLKTTAEEKEAGDYAVYLVEHVGFSIQEAAERTGVSEFWLNLKFPEERKITASNKYKLEKSNTHE